MGKELLKHASVLLVVFNMLLGNTVSIYAEGTAETAVPEEIQETVEETAPAETEEPAVAEEPVEEIEMEEEKPAEETDAEDKDDSDSYDSDLHIDNYEEDDLSVTTGETGYADFFDYYKINYSISDGEATITGHDYKDGITNLDVPENLTLAIPGTIEGYPVTAIGQEAFYAVYELAEIIIPEGVKSIGYHAFYLLYDDNLKSITIPGSVTDIGSQVFGDVSNITTAGPIGGGYDYEFGWTTGIPDGAFRDFSSLTSVTLPDSLTRIGSQAFYNCSSLNSISLPNSITEIGILAFYNCSNMNLNSFPTALTNIDSSAFENCSSLTAAVLPDGLRELGQEAFKNCTSLSYVRIPESMTSKWMGVFRGCPGLKTAGPIGGGYNLEFGWTANIPMCAFYDCSSLTSVTIPETITSIGGSAFEGCTQLKTAGPIGGGYDYEFGWTEAIPADAFNGSSLSEIDIPETITRIGNSAFARCKNLQTVAIPESVTDMGGWVFNECTNLQSVTLPGKITQINDGTFKECTSLLSIEIPDGVKTIGSYAFKNCSGLRSVIIPESVEKCYAVFEGCTNLTTAGPIGGDYDIQFGWTASIPKYAFKSVPLTNVKIPESITSIDEGAFANCEKLSSIVIPESVTDMRFGVFDGCTSLKTAGPIDGGYDLEFGWTNKIPENAFELCDGLVTIKIPNTITEIGFGAFVDCINLKNVSLSGKLEKIPPLLFKGCSSIEKIWIPTSVQTIGNNAFSNCTQLKSVIIPKLSQTQHDGDEAFKGDENLKDIYYCGSEEEWKNVTIEGWDIPESTIIHYNYNPVIETLRALFPKRTVRVPTGKYTFAFVDVEGVPVENAKVSYNGYSDVTDAKGMITIDNTFDKLTLTVSKDGYEELTLEDDPWPKKVSRFEEFVLYESKEHDYYLKSAQYIGSDYTADILYSVKKIGIPTSEWVDMIGSTNVELKFQAYNEDAVAVYRLKKDDQIIAESTDGSFSLDLSNFNVGGGYYIETVPKDDGTLAYKTDINLVFFDLNDDSFSIGFKNNKFTVKVPDDIPYFGGSDINVKIPEGTLPAEVVLTPDKFYVGINLDVKNWDASPAETKAKYDKLLKQFDIVEELKNFAVEDGFAEFKHQIEDLARYENDLQLIGNDTLKLRIIGFLEGNFDDSSFEGKLLLVAEWKGSFTHTFITPIAVPIVVNIDASVKVSSGPAFSIIPDEGKINGSVPLNPEFKLEPFAGVGVGHITGIGVYGDAKFKEEIILEDTEKENIGLQSMTLEGSYGGKVYVGIFEYKKEWAYNKWYLYSRNEDDISSSTGFAENFEESIDDASLYTVEDLNYISSESKWQGNALNSSSGSLLNNLSLSTLQSGVYQNSQPVTVSDGENIYLAFLRADAGTKNIYTAVSKFDGSVWSEPVALTDKAVLDDAPQICLDKDGNLWTAYTRATESYNSETPTLLNYAQTRELVVQRLDKGTFEVLDEHVYEAEGFMYGQKLALVDDNLILSWIDAEVLDDNSVLNPGNGKIYRALISSESFEDKTLVYASDQTVHEIEVGKYNQEIAVAFTIDPENNGSMNLYAAANESSILISSDINGNVSYGMIPGKQEKEFVWNTQESLKGASGTEIQADGITGYYSLCNGLYYSSSVGDITSEADGYQTGFREIILTEDGYSHDVIQLLNSKYLENVSVQEINGIKYVIGLNTNAQITDELIIDKDLVCGAITEVNDIMIINYEVDQSIIEVGAEIPVTLTIKNNGNQLVESIDVVINGENTTYDVSVKPGETVTLTANVSCPESETAYNISVAGNGGTEDEYQKQDNTISFSLCESNLVLNTSLLKSGDQIGVQAVVTNIGGTSTSGKITLYQSDGNECFSESFEALDYDEVITFNYWMTEDELASAGERMTIVVEGDQTDADLRDNQKVISLKYDYEPLPISAEGVTISQTEADLVPGETLQLTYTMIPETAANKNATWSSSDESVATVDQNGLVTILSEGDAIITVTTEDGGYSATCTLHSLALVEAVNLSQTILKLQIGDTETLQFTVSPENAGYTKSFWYSSNTDAVTVDNNGLVTAVGKGLSKVQAVVIRADGKYIYSTCNVYVGLSEDLGDVTEEDAISVNGEIPEGLWVAGIPSKNWYTGSKQTFDFRVYDGKKLLSKGTDYTVAYKNNVQAYTLKEGEEGFSAKKAPQIIIKAKGNYKESRTVYFTIEPADISIYGYLTSYRIYNGKDQKQSLTVIFEGKTLKKGTDYTVEYLSEGYKDPGTYEIKVTGKGNYTGEITYLLTIKEAGTIDLSKATVTLEEKSYAYDGNQIKPVIKSVKVGKTVIDPSEYTVIYGTNTQVGLGVVVLRGNGTTTINTKVVTFKITGTPITKLISVTVLKSVTRGTDLKTAVTISTGLTEGTDYEVIYPATENAGKATIVIKGINGYTGTIKKTVTVSKDKLTATNTTVTLPETIMMMKNGAKPVPTVTVDGTELVEGTDYTLSYANNKKAGTGTVTVKGKGNYTGSVKQNFTIAAKDLSETTLVFANNVNSSTKKGSYKTTVVIKDKDGGLLKANTDYTLKFYDGDAEIPAAASANDYLGKTLTVKASGKGNYTGEDVLSSEYTVVESTYNLAKASIVIKPQQYLSGKLVEITSQDQFKKAAMGKNQLTLGTDFKVYAYSNNTARGTATVVFEGIGEYSGYKSVTYKIGQRSFKEAWTGVVSFFARLLN